MPAMTSSAAIAAGATSTPLTGKLFEFVPPPAAGISVAICGSAIGLVASLTIGGRTIIDSEQVGQQNRWPIVPDDYIVAGEAGLAGERIVLRINNPTGGALTHFTRVDVSPL